MGVVQSVAQGIANKIKINVEKAIIHDLPDGPEAQLVGTVDGTVDVTNTNPLAVGAAIKAAVVYLEMPVVKGYEAFAGIFSYFDLPALKIGLGKKAHDYHSVFVVTNKTRYAMWAAAMMANPGGIDLNIHAKPTVSIAAIDPIKYVLNVDKHIQCKLPEQDVVATQHFGAPPCLPDEYELWDGQTVICAAGCKGTIQNCPTDLPETLAPKYGVSCNDSTPEFPDGLCLYHCFNDEQCGGTAICQIDEPTNRQLGFCTYATNATHTTTTTISTTTTTTTKHNQDPLPMTCSFIGNAAHVEPDAIV